jgi:2-phosphosulfolactate phosphatase
LAHWEVGAVEGPVVAIDVIRAFTTAAYAFAAGAREIHLTETLAETYTLLDANPTWLAMGEEHGRRPDRFALSNSPVHAAAADLDDRTIVQRTSAGTRGALAARHAYPLLCASLVVASATAEYLNTRSPGLEPAYVITGRFADASHATGDEDLATAEYIDRRRHRAAKPHDTDEAIRRVLSSPDAATTVALGPEHVHPDDLRYCTAVDRFDFAMVTTRTPAGLTLRATKPVRWRL